MIRLSGAFRFAAAALSSALASSSPWTPTFFDTSAAAWGGKGTWRAGGMGCGWGEGKAEVGAAAAADASEAGRDQGARPRSETQELGGARWASARRRRTEAREGGVLAEHGGQRLAPLARHAVVSEVEVRQPLVDLSAGGKGRRAWRMLERRRAGCGARPP